MNGERVFVAMSGGVDSSVTALLLVREGYDVTGVTMLLTPDDSPGPCCGSAGVRDAKHTCQILGIPHLTVDGRDLFEREVVAPFARAYAEGCTPNPCIDCNEHLKFRLLLERAALHAVGMLATGHYARIVEDESGPLAVARAVDRTRDQSYFLYRLDAERLRHLMFPLGTMTKAEVKRIARDAGLPAAISMESRDVCFVTDDENRVELVTERHPEAGMPGPVVSVSGERIGEHQGIARYTVGQRKGFGSAGLGHAAYVTRIDAAANVIQVGPADALLVRRIVAEDAVWRGGEGLRQAECVVRYRQQPVACAVRAEGTILVVEPAEPLGGVAPGQAVVCYDGDTVLGGGVIASTE